MGSSDHAGKVPIEIFPERAETKGEADEEEYEDEDEDEDEYIYD